MAKKIRLALCAAVVASGATEVSAQLRIPVLQPVIPFNYSRGRNVSVTERARPEYQATGVPLGAFIAYPKLTLSGGGTNNVFENDLEKRSGGIFVVSPDVRVQSGWSRNLLDFDAGADIRRTTSTDRRDENGWHVRGIGRLDLGNDSSIQALGSTAKLYETGYSGSTPRDNSSVIPYQFTNAQLRQSNELGRFRLTAVFDYVNATFGQITLLDGTERDQRFRNRNVYTGEGQLEYAINPDVSAFAQFSYAGTDYDRPLTIGLGALQNNRSSQTYTGIAGISSDITAVIRGSFGIGYTHRNYNNPALKNFGGVSVETRIEYFPSELTTVTLAGRRAIEDSSFLNSSGYFNSGVGLRIDHEFLRNLLGNVGFDYENDNYRGIDAAANVFIVQGGGRYLVNRWLGLGANLSYGQRHNSGTQLVGPTFNETSGLFSIYLQR